MVEVTLGAVVAELFGMVFTVDDLRQPLIIINKDMAATATAK
jgi:hypothetical protein